MTTTKTAGTRSRATCTNGSARPPDTATGNSCCCSVVICCCCCYTVVVVVVVCRTRPLGPWNRATWCRRWPTSGASWARSDRAVARAVGTWQPRPRCPAGWTARWTGCPAWTASGCPRTRRRRPSTTCPALAICRRA